MSKTQSAANTKVAIASGAPATYDAAGFAAQAWKNMGKVKNVAEFGKQFDIITNNYLSQRGAEKKKANWNGGQLNMELDLLDGDLGQELAYDALDSDDDYSFRVTLQNGTVYYLRCLVTAFRVMTGSSSDMVRGNLSTEVNPIFTAAGDEVASIKVPAAP